MTRDATDFARRIRGHALRMVGAAKASHIGSCLSCADILAVLYAEVLRVDPARTDWPERDRFVLSKGHGCVSYYAKKPGQSARAYLSLLRLISHGPVSRLHLSGSDQSVN